MEKRSKFFSESQLVEEIVQFLLKEGYKKIKREVPTMGQRADLVALKEGLVTIVEAKINHKKQVLEQCNAHDVVADYICIAWGGKNISPSLYEDAEKSGYGIIHYSPLHNEYRWAIRPVKNEKFWEPQKHILVSKAEDLPDAY